MLKTKGMESSGNNGKKRSLQNYNEKTQWGHWLTHPELMTSNDTQNVHKIKTRK